MRLIDADALMPNAEYKGRYDVVTAYDIANAPTIEPERKKGKWIDHSDEGYVECPFCHNATNCDENKDELHFCFSCGADMRGEEE